MLEFFSFLAIVVASSYLNYQAGYARAKKHAIHTCPKCGCSSAEDQSA